VAKALGRGRRGELVEVAVVSSGDAVVTPCGRCRQVLNEAADLGHRDITVYCASADGAVMRRHLLSDLLPFAFGPTDLGLDTAS
jgi:cytidine deaminase